MGSSSTSFDSALSKWRTKRCAVMSELHEQIACAHVSGICICIACCVLILDWMCVLGKCVWVCMCTSETWLVVVSVLMEQTVYSDVCIVIPPVFKQ